MKKVLMVFQPLNEAQTYIATHGGEQFAPHHYWCYDQLKANGYTVDFVESTDGTNWLNRLGNKLGLISLQQQIRTIKKSRSYDVVYAPYMEHIFLLALLKVLKLYKKEVVAIAHYDYPVNKKNILKRLKQKFFQNIYYRGTDKILLYNRDFYKKCRQQNTKGNCEAAFSWGIDYEFYRSYISAQSRPPNNDYVFSTGGSKRDFKTLIKAFNGVDFPLKITTVGHFEGHEDCEISANIEIDNSLPFGMGSPGLIRKDYYNALAVAVPLEKTDTLATYGLTVVMEAMAMGKPVIITQTEAYPFNVAKEKVGLVVAHGDVEGWRRAVNFLIDHPDEARKMGERGKKLIKEQFNYRAFSHEVIAQIDKGFTVREPAWHQESPVREESNNNIISAI